MPLKDYRWTVRAEQSCGAGAEITQYIVFGRQDTNADEVSPIRNVHLKMAVAHASVSANYILREIVAHFLDGSSVHLWGPLGNRSDMGQAWSLPKWELDTTLEDVKNVSFTFGNNHGTTSYHFWGGLLWKPIK